MKKIGITVTIIVVTCIITGIVIQNIVSKSTILQKKHIGYIRDIRITQSGYTLSIDEIQREKCINQTDFCPNGYQIINTTEDTKTFLIDPNATIYMQTFSHDTGGNFNRNEVIDVQTLYTILQNQQTDYHKNITAAKHYKNTPFRIELSGNKVVTITEQYVP